MPNIKSPCLAILGLSLVFSGLPVPLQAEAPADPAKGAGVRHVALVYAEDSCDEPPERAIFAGPLFESQAGLTAAAEDTEDDDDQGDQLGRAPVAIDSELGQRHEPPGSDGVPTFDVVFRAEKTFLAVFSRAGPAVDPDPEEEIRTASLLLQRHRARTALGLESGRRSAGLIVTTASGRPPESPTRTPSGLLPRPRTRVSPCSWSHLPPAGEADRRPNPSIAPAAADASKLR